MMAVYIDKDSIRIKIDTFMDSKEDEVNRIAQNKIMEYEKKGITRTQGGSKIVTDTFLKRAADDLVTAIKQSASGIAPSVMANLSTIRPGALMRYPDGSREINISLDDSAFRRESLMPEIWGEGITNIILLFEKGYPLSKGRYHVRGIWHGEDIHAKLGRKGLGFIAKAISEFNNMHSKEGVTAIANYQY